MTAWEQANQRFLRAAVAVAHTRLLHAVKTAGDDTPPASSPELDQAVDDLHAARADMPAAAAADQVAALFGLSAFELDVVLLCTAVELDAAVAELCRQAAPTGGPPTANPTIGLALALLPGARWSALAPTAPLRYWQLIEVGDGELISTSPLRIDERILHELLGVGTVDARVADRVRRVPHPTGLAPSQVALAREAAGAWADGDPWPVVHLMGAVHTDREQVAVEIAGIAGLAALACALADPPADRRLLSRLLEREAALAGAALVVDLDGPSDPALAAQLGGPLVVLSGSPVALPGRTVLRHDVAPPTRAERMELWRAVAPGAAEAELHAVAARFPLGATAIGAAARSPGGIWESCRRAARPELGRLAQRRTATRGWDGLVLPAEQLDLLRQLTTQARQQARVLEDWGFADDTARGLGVTALFAGPSGTGKTTAAEVVAAELELDLFCVDLSTVVDKYIGETEKNLGRVFDAAEGGAAVLLFDEADALFGKRSEVRDSHDRYANLEVAYLLQRMECYRGLAILTTNARSALDPAFLRRLRFMVTFPFPEAAQRAELWRRAFPPGAPTDGLDPARLARLTVAGGSIHSIALNAAFLAADAGRAITTADVVRAARAEYAKLDRPLSEAELRGLR